MALQIIRIRYKMVKRKAVKSVQEAETFDDFLEALSGSDSENEQSQGKAEGLRRSFRCQLYFSLIAVSILR